MKKTIIAIHGFMLRAAEAPGIRRVVQFSKSKKIFPKATCLVLAGVLWFYVESKRINEAHFRILMQVDIAHEFAVADMEKKYLTVTARGSADDLRNVLPGNITVIVKIQNPKLGSATRYPVTVIGTGLPDTVSIVPEDKTVFVTAEKRAVKRIPVIPVTEGTLDSHYTAGAIRVVPDEVEISGAESVITKISSIRTEPVLLSGRTAGFQQTVKLGVEDFKYSELSLKQVEAVVQIFETRGITALTVVPLLKGVSENADYAILNKSIRVLVKNDKDEDIFAEEIDAFCDVPPVDSKTASGEDIIKVLPVSVKSKTGHTIIAVNPEKIIVKIRKK
jgi:hypothetical protein